MTDTSTEAVESLIYDLKFEDWDYTSEVVRDLLAERDTLRAQLQASRDEALEAVSARDALRRACRKIRKTCQKGGLSIGLRMTKMDDTARDALRSTSTEGDE
ncbi:hypothetical protein PhaeoP24_01209 [Phaeobacter inhibens]|uniref:hypothetical protein n=1 Tax=Phaeobacter inhibens TaxID=221822 RepID=UPI000C9B0D79|nr:hypothetical protein [Phaeobacter inhibens]AUQ89837.1 hypothetical protein PhaeoP24_01209 [Phaeobacter inhibens]